MTAGCTTAFCGAAALLLAITALLLYTTAIGLHCLPVLPCLQDREPDEDEEQFSLTRFVPMLQEVLEDAGVCSGVGRLVHGQGLNQCRPSWCACVVCLCGVFICTAQNALLDCSILLCMLLLVLSPPHPAVRHALAAAASGKLSTDEYPYVRTPSSPGASSMPSSTDSTPKAGVERMQM